MLGTQITRATFFNLLREGMVHKLRIRHRKIAHSDGGLTMLKKVMAFLISSSSYLEAYSTINLGV
jgi:hypothetical protein